MRKRYDALLPVLLMIFAGFLILSTIPRPPLTTASKRFTAHHAAIRETSAAPISAPDRRPRRRRRPYSCKNSSTGPQNFLMAFMGRSGSSAIMSDIGQHPSVHLFGTEPIDHQAEFNATAGLAIARRIFTSGARKGFTTGFKIRPQHVRAEPERWRALVEEFDIRVMWQYRRNVMKDGIGEYNYAREGLRGGLRKVMGGLRERGGECSGGNGCRLRIGNMSELHSVMQRRVGNNGMIAEAARVLTGGEGCVLEVPYEDYLYDREGSLREVFEFLGLRWVETEVKRFKATGDNMCEIVENWAEVCDMFYGCVLWQEMLEDRVNDCYCPSRPRKSPFCQVSNGVKHYGSVYKMGGGT